jgi:DNA-binding response OmpR family regulator
MMLERGGFDTDIALTAADAKRLLAENAYAAMTVDLALPDQLGTSLIRELRTEEGTRELPIIVVSAHVDAGSKELNGDAFGIIDWISKPFDPERILRGIRLAVRRHDNGKPRVLHVEDDPDVLTVVSNIVGNAAEVTPAKDLKEARRWLSDEDFDLVILDLILPDGSGERLIPFLRKPASGSIPVIVFSAKEMSRETAENVAAALVKSETSNEDLMNTIKSILDVREQI